MHMKQIPCFILCMLHFFLYFIFSKILPKAVHILQATSQYIGISKNKKYEIQNRKKLCCNYPLINNIVCLCTTTTIWPLVKDPSTFINILGTVLASNKQELEGKWLYFKISWLSLKNSCQWSCFHPKKLCISVLLPNHVLPCTSSWLLQFFSVIIHYTSYFMLSI